MKKYIKDYSKLVVLFVAISLVASCNDEFLTENPDTFVSPQFLLVDESGAQTYLNGAYDAVQQSIATTGNGNGDPRWSIHWGTQATDLLVVPRYASARVSIYLQQVTTTTPAINSLWVRLYRSLNRINSVIDRVGAMTADQIDADVKNSIVAQAKFLRTTINFALVSSWENVPLISKEVVTLENVNVKQASPQEVYDFMIEDLKTIIPILPNEQGGGRVTAGAATALLGKIYLQMTGFPLNQSDKFALAEAAFANVMNSGTYNLLPDYGTVFNPAFEQSNEIVFSIGLDGPGANEGGILGSFYGPVGSGENGGGFATCFIQSRFSDSYDIDDARLRNNIAKHNANRTSPEEAVIDSTTWTVNPNTWRAWKWHAAKPNNYRGDSPFDYIYIRYADVLLMYAEALNGQDKLTQAAIDNTVNRLRARARLTPTAVPDMVLGSKEENSIALLDERRKELCFEGWRRNDLIRFGKYREAISGITQPLPNAGDPGPNYEDFEIRWPIPETQRQLNPNLVQNPGY